MGAYILGLGNDLPACIDLMRFIARIERGERSDGRFWDTAYHSLFPFAQGHDLNEHGVFLVGLGRMGIPLSLCKSLVRSVTYYFLYLGRRSFLLHIQHLSVFNTSLSAPFSGIFGMGHGINL
jgi:hypothetical protein